MRVHDLWEDAVNSLPSVSCTFTRLTLPAPKSRPAVATVGVEEVATSRSMAARRAARPPAW